MQVLWFAGLLVCVYFGTLFGFHYWIKRQPQKMVDERLNIGAGVYPLGAFILGMAGSSVIWGAPTALVCGILITTLLFMSFCAVRFPSIKAKCLWVPLSCGMGMYAAFIGTAHMQIMPLSFVIGWATWSAVMGMVLFFDRVPLLNFLTFGSWALAIAVIGFLNDFLPPEISIPCLLAFAAIWPATNVMSNHMRANLGPYGTAFLGFVMGGVVALCMVAHSYGSVVSMLGYYLFEGFFFVSAWFGLKPFGMKRGDFAFTTVLLGANPARIIRLVFYRLVILALMAMMMWQTNRLAILVLIIFIVLLDTYNRFKAFGAKAPTMKEMWQETKAGLKDLWHQYSEFFKKTSSKRKETPQSLATKQTKVAEKVKVTQKKGAKRSVKRKKKK